MTSGSSIIVSVQNTDVDIGLRQDADAAISSTLSALPILAPDLFGEVASGKNRTQN
jgi:hypothetical protein